MLQSVEPRELAAPLLNLLAWAGCLIAPLFYLPNYHSLDDEHLSSDPRGIPGMLVLPMH